MELRDYLRILHKNWILILILTLVGAIAGGTYAFTKTPLYESTTQLYVSVQSEGAATGDLVQGTTFARQIVASYVDVVDTALVLQPVIDKLKLETTVNTLAEQVSASTPLNTVMIDITVTDPSPAHAAAIADATAASLTDAVQSTLEQSGTDNTKSPVRITTVQPATVPTAPSSPKMALSIALGLLVGLAAGVGIAVLRSVLDTRIRSLHDLEQITDAPLLGGIAFDQNASAQPLVVQADPRSPRAESFRTLRTNLQFVNVEGGPRSFVISSSGPGEGKSTTSANLALALADTGARVVLVDGDLRLPRVADYMGIEGGLGLTDVLIGRVELPDALQKWGRGQFFVLPSGQVPPNPSELLGSTAMDHVLSALTEHFDYVLMDAPPLLLVTDAAVLSKKTRGVILVAASGKTRKPELMDAIKSLNTAGGRLLGVVATMLPVKGPDSYGYGAYTYGATHSDAKVTRVEAKRRRVRAKHTKQLRDSRVQRTGSVLPEVDTAGH